MTAKKKTDDNKSTKRVADIVDMEIDKAVLAKILKATKNVIPNNDDVAIRFYNDGIYFCQVAPKQIASCSIALSTSGDYITKYKAINGHEIFVDQDQTLGAIVSFIAATGKKEKIARVRVDQTHIKINIGRASKKLKILEWPENALEDISNSMKALHNITKNFNHLITVDSESFAHVIKNFSRINGTRDYFDLTCDKEHFILFRTLDDSDDIEVDLVTMKRGRMRKQPFEGKYPVDSLATAVMNLAPLAEELTITGDSNSPVLLSAGKAPVPEEDPKFDQDIAFWYVLAPRIAME